MRSPGVSATAARMVASVSAEAFRNVTERSNFNVRPDVSSRSADCFLGLQPAKRAAKISAARMMGEYRPGLLDLKRQLVGIGFKVEVNAVLTLLEVFAFDLAIFAGCFPQFEIGVCFI